MSKEISTEVVPSQLANENKTAPVQTQIFLDFTLVATKLKMGFSKTDEEGSLFVVLPQEHTASEGMTIEKMVEDINLLVKGYTGKDTDLDAKQMQEALEEAKDTAKKDQANVDTNAALDWKKILVRLRQCFLLLGKDGKGDKIPVEYALQIDVDFSELFPKDVSFVKVEKLSLAVWNTKRQWILDMMEIVEIKALLAEPND